MPTYRSASGSSAEDLFIELFSDTFALKRPAISGGKEKDRADLPGEIGGLL